jgi:dienelactone hydrolase
MTWCRPCFPAWVRRSCRVSASLLVLSMALSCDVAAEALAVERVEIPPPHQTSGLKPATLIGYVLRPATQTAPHAGTASEAQAPKIHGPAIQMPAIIALHGCGGLFRPNGELTRLTRDWAERWVRAGYVVVFPDSFGSRGLGPQCTVVDRKIVPRHRADDVNAVALWLARQPFVDARRMALVGWSNGGSTVLSALRPNGQPVGVDPTLKSGSEPGIEFKTAIAFYPGCRGFLAATTWVPRVPLTILIGSIDDWTPAEPCVALQSRANVRTIVYPDAYHGFDAPDVAVRVRTGLKYSVGGDGLAHVGTNPVARAAAIDEVMARLAMALK